MSCNIRDAGEWDQLCGNSRTSWTLFIGYGMVIEASKEIPLEKSTP
jgi:hypothetical protein